MADKSYYVYFITNKYNNVLYIGVTNDLKRRIWEYKTGRGGGFAKKYNCDKLVCYEIFGEINDALNREGQLKKWVRDKKNVLVNRENPLWQDWWESIAHQC